MVRIDNGGLGYSYHLPAGGLGLRIRNALSQFSDLFSEFNKYIAPAYHHDRCERSVQMRLYSMHKREFVMVLIAFFACFGLAFFIGLAGPPITNTFEVNARTLLSKDNQSYSSLDIATGPFIMRTPPLSSYAQQLWRIVKWYTYKRCFGLGFGGYFTHILVLWIVLGISKCNSVNAGEE